MKYDKSLQPAVIPREKKGEWAEAANHGPKNVGPEREV
jgi:hypothetical protein